MDFIKDYTAPTEKNNIIKELEETSDLNTNYKKLISDYEEIEDDDSELSKYKKILQLLSRSKWMSL